jgi:hypothetical protein
MDQALDQEPERLAGEAERMVNEPGYESFAYRHHGYLARGCYAEQLERLYALVSPSRVLALQSEMLLADPNAVLGRVWRFLDLPPHILSYPRRLDSGSYEPMPDTIRDRLRGYYEVPNRRLYKLPGVDFRWPSS